MKAGGRGHEVADDPPVNLDEALAYITRPPGNRLDDELETELSSVREPEPVIAMPQPQSQSQPGQVISADDGALADTVALEPRSDTHDCPWRDPDLDATVKARLFTKAIVAAHANSGTARSGETLDHEQARRVVERTWNLTIGKLQEHALLMGADPVRILKVSAEGVAAVDALDHSGLQMLDAREAVQAFIVLRLVKMPPLLGERRLREQIDGLACAHPCCVQKTTGVPCAGGCKWANVPSSSGSSSEYLHNIHRHTGLVELQKLAMFWDVSPHEVFRCTSIPDVMKQKDQLASLIIDRARSKDFVPPPKPEEPMQSDNIPDTDAELSKLTQSMEKLVRLGQLRTDGMAWEEEPPSCCNGRVRCCCCKINSPSLQILFSMKGTALEWCLKGAQMWISIGVYIVTRILVRRFRRPEEREQFPPMEAPHIIGGFLSFFLVFYASQAYNRFTAMYDNSMACLGRIFDVCTLAKVNISCQAAVIRLWRHINLAHVLAYTDVSDTYSVQNFLEPMNQKYGLCSRAEWRRIMELNPDCSSGSNLTREAIAWAVNDIILQTKAIERPDRAFEHMTLHALFKRAKHARVPAHMYDDQSTLWKVAFAPDREPLNPLDDDRSKLIEAILKDPEASPPVHTWNTDTVKEWILDLDDVVLDDTEAVAEALHRNGITGCDLLQLTPDKLNMLGISQIHSQMRVMKAIRCMTGQDEVLSPPQAFKLVSEVLQIRSQLQLLYDSQFPVPFFYVHLLHLTCALYLPMFAYSLALGSEIPESCSSVESSRLCWNQLWWELSGAIIIAVQNIIVIGLARSGQQLADPYGIDVVDLPVRSWVVWGLDASKSIVTSSKDLVPPTDSLEAAIQDLRPTKMKPKAAIKRLQNSAIKDRLGRFSRSLTIRQADIMGASTTSTQQDHRTTVP